MVNLEHLYSQMYIDNYLVLNLEITPYQEQLRSRISNKPSANQLYPYNPAKQYKCV